MKNTSHKNSREGESAKQKSGKPFMWLAAALFIFGAIWIFESKQKSSDTEETLQTKSEEVLESKTLAEKIAENFPEIQKTGTYEVRDTSVYYGDMEIVGADAKTFTLVDEYGVDKNSVYYAGKSLGVEIDPQSFRVVGGGVVKDSSRVYVRNSVDNQHHFLSEADVSTFDYIGRCMSLEKSFATYFKDKHNIFVDGKKMDTIDRGTFMYLGSFPVAEGAHFSVSYAADKDNIFHTCGEILMDADRATFTILADGYAKDADTVWYLAKIIQDADPFTFNTLGFGYAKDKNNAYFMNEVIQNADIGTFEVRGQGIEARDKNNIYGGGVIIEKSE